MIGRPVIVEHLFGDNDTLLIAFDGFDSAVRDQVHQTADPLARGLRLAACGLALTSRFFMTVKN
jgi:2-polyprenyl-6-methoxyphenol hydroxylase-like FAD-dependent oxidoreductase